MARPKGDIDVRILHAARAHFLATGVDAASLRAIAKSAGTNIGMIYYYFPSKDDLFLAVVEEVYSRLLGAISVALADDAPVAERILRLYTRLGQLDQVELDVVRLVLREALTSNVRFEQLFGRFQRGHIPLLLRTASDGLGDGTFAPNHPLLVTVALMALGAAPQAVLRLLGPLAPPGLPSGEALAHRLRDMLLHGVGRVPTQAPPVGGDPETPAA